MWHTIDSNLSEYMCQSERICFEKSDKNPNKNPKKQQFMFMPVDSFMLMDILNQIWLIDQTTVQKIKEKNAFKWHCDT